MYNPVSSNILTCAASFTASMVRFAAGGFRTVSHQTYQDRFAGQRTILKGSFSTDSGFSTTTNDFQNEYTRDGKGRLTGIKQTKQGTGGSYSVVADKNFVLGYNGQDQLIDLDRYASTGTSNLVAHTDYDRDYMGRLTKLDHLKGGTHFATYDLARDARSRITAIDSVFSNSAWDEDHNFTYDHTDQLIAADHSVQNDEAYNFTANGNRDGNQTHLGATTSSTVTANNQISNDGVYNYTYDNEGNTLTKITISTSDKQEFTWDHRNRLIKVTFKNSSNVIQKTVEHFYDHADLLIRTVETPYSAGVAGTPEADIYVRDGAQILLAFHATGSGAAALTNRYLWSDQIDVLLADEQVTSLGSAGTVYWVLVDHQNSVVDLVTYNSGTDTTTVAKHRKFNGFGNITSDSAPGIKARFAYTGMMFEITTGLQYNWHRWYDMFRGEWMSEDPIGFEGGDENLSRYVANDPVTGTDPSGLDRRVIVDTSWGGHSFILVDEWDAAGRKIGVKQLHFSASFGHSLIDGCPDNGHVSVSYRSTPAEDMALIKAWKEMHDFESSTPPLQRRIGMGLSWVVLGFCHGQTIYWSRYGGQVNGQYYWIKPVSRPLREPILIEETPIREPIFLE